MKLPFRNFDALRLSFMVFIAVLVVAGYAVNYAQETQERERKSLEREEVLLREARLRYQRSGQEKALIEHYLPEYRRLEAEGFIGAGARINWLDGLRLANQQADLFGVDYQLGAQKAYAGAQADGQLALEQAEMKISFYLLHEGDLLRFFTILREQRVGLFSLDECTLQRLSLQTNVVRFEPKLRAECVVSWIAVSPGRKNEGKP
jgi:hypothetical protein